MNAYLFILQMSILGLNVVKLVSKCEVILVSLLDFKDLSLQLRNEEVFLVASKVHAVVVL